MNSMVMHGLLSWVEENTAAHWRGGLPFPPRRKHAMRWIPIDARSCCLRSNRLYLWQQCAARAAAMKKAGAAALRVRLQGKMQD
jgi:hypothetical protein